VKIPAWRSLFITLFVVAFAFQNCITQSHIHRALIVSDSGSVVDPGSKAIQGKAAGLPAPSGKQNQNPATDDSANCPICQAFALTSHFVAASGIVIAAPTQISWAFVTADLAVSILSAASHSWRSRGPPSI
jgi:hypothetical protein